MPNLDFFAKFGMNSFGNIKYMSYGLKRIEKNSKQNLEKRHK